MSRYLPPSGATGTDDPYVGLNVPAGTDGSKVPKGAIEYTQREIQNAHLAAGNLPTNDDVTQLAQDIGRGIWVGPLGANPNSLNGTIGAGVDPSFTPRPYLANLLPWTRMWGIASQTNTSTNVSLTVTGIGTAAGVKIAPLLKRDGTAPAVGDVPVGIPFAFYEDTSGNWRFAERVASDQASGGGSTTVAAGRNRFLDPGFLVSQRALPDTESYYPSAPNYSPALTLVSGVRAYASDGCYALRNGATGAATVQRIAGPSFSGGAFWQRIAVITANAAPGSNDFLGWVLPIEGPDIADLEWGTAAAKPFTVGFDTRFPAGTYSAAIQNGDGAGSTRSNPVTFAVTSDGALGTLKTVTFPGDQSGAWNTAKGARGLCLVITLCAGAGLTGAAGQQGGNVPAAAGQSNAMAAAGGVYDIAAPRGNVGTALAPYDPPSYGRAYADAMRYFQTLTHFEAFSDLSGSQVVAKLKFLVPMAKAPVANLSGPATIMLPGYTYYTQSSPNISFDHTGDFSEGGMAIMQAFSGLPNSSSFIGYFNAGQYIRLDASI